MFRWPFYFQSNRVYLDEQQEEAAEQFTSNDFGTHIAQRDKKTNRKFSCYIKATLTANCALNLLQVKNKQWLFSFKGKITFKHNSTAVRKMTKKKCWSFELEISSVQTNVIGSLIDCWHRVVQLFKGCKPTTADIIRAKLPFQFSTRVLSRSVFICGLC